MGKGNMSDSTVPTLSAQPPVLPSSAPDRGAGIASWLLLALVVVPHFPLRADSDANYGRIDAQLVLRLGLCAACGLYGLANFSRVKNLLNHFPLAWMVLVGAVAAAMIPFSADPRQALAACTVLWSVLLFVPAALLRLGSHRTLLTVLAGSAVYLLAQWSLCFLAPEIGQSVELRPDGDPIVRVGGDPQQLGFQSVVTVGLAMIFLRKGQLSRRWHWMLLGLAAVTLVGAKSRTAAIAALVGAGLLLVRRLHPARRNLFVVAGGCAVCLAFLMLSMGLPGATFETLEASFARSGTGHEIESVTGRTDIWHFALEKIGESPIVGWGYCCVPAVSEKFDFPLRHAHNEVLNVAFSLGIAGAIPLLGMFLQQLFSVWSTKDDLPLFVTAAGIIAGLTEPVLFLAMPTALMILWIVVLCRREQDAPAVEIGIEAGPVALA